MAAESTVSSSDICIASTATANEFWTNNTPEVDKHGKTDPVVVVVEDEGDTNRIIPVADIASEGTAELQCEFEVSPPCIPLEITSTLESETLVTHSQNTENYDETKDVDQHNVTQERVDVPKASARERSVVGENDDNSRGDNCAEYTCSLPEETGAENSIAQTGREFPAETNKLKDDTDNEVVSKASSCTGNVVGDVEAASTSTSIFKEIDLDSDSSVTSANQNHPTVTSTNQDHSTVALVSQSKSTMASTNEDHSTVVTVASAHQNRSLVTESNRDNLTECSNITPNPEVPSNQEAAKSSNPKNLSDNAHGSGGIWLIPLKRLKVPESLVRKSSISSGPENLEEPPHKPQVEKKVLRVRSTSFPSVTPRYRPVTMEKVKKIRKEKKKPKTLLDILKSLKGRPWSPPPGQKVVKRTVGRPRRAPVHVTKAKKVNKGSLEVKRGRGRPRKAVATEKKEGNQVDKALTPNPTVHIERLQEKDTVVVVKRPRGRPPKKRWPTPFTKGMLLKVELSRVNVSKSAVTTATKDVHSIATKDDPSTAPRTTRGGSIQVIRRSQGSPNEPGVKRPRGRPPRPSPDVPKTDAEEQPVVKKLRGRPRKIGTDSLEEPPNKELRVELSRLDGEDNSQKVKRPRGRPPRSEQKKSVEENKSVAMTKPISSTSGEFNAKVNNSSQNVVSGHFLSNLVDVADDTEGDDTFNDDTVNDDTVDDDTDDHKYDNPKSAEKKPSSEVTSPRGRGRPRMADSSRKTTITPSRGRGRPRLLHSPGKLPQSESSMGQGTSLKSPLGMKDVSAKRGRGRPRTRVFSPPAPGKRPRGRPPKKATSDNDTTQNDRVQRGYIPPTETTNGPIQPYFSISQIDPAVGMATGNGGVIPPPGAVNPSMMRVNDNRYMRLSQPQECTPPVMTVVTISDDSDDEWGGNSDMSRSRKNVGQQISASLLQQNRTAIAGVNQGSEIQQPSRSGLYTTTIVYKCSFCNSTFMDAAHMEVHLRSHTEERPCQCSVCGEGFTVEEALGLHLQNHTASFYQCTLCGASFTERHKLQTHCKAHVQERIDGTFGMNSQGHRRVQQVPLQRSSSQGDGWIRSEASSANPMYGSWDC